MEQMNLTKSGVIDMGLEVIQGERQVAERAVLDLIIRSFDPKSGITDEEIDGQLNDWSR